MWLHVYILEVFADLDDYGLALLEDLFSLEVAFDLLGEFSFRQ